MRRGILAFLASFSVLSRASLALAAGDDGFVPVDPAALDTVDGRSLMITAYAVIVGLILLYSLSLLLRQRSVQKKAKKLLSKLQSKADAKSDTTA